MHRTARFLPGDSYKASLSHVGQTSDRAPPSGPPRDGMIGMALSPGLLEREGRILAKADRLAHGASSYLQAGATRKAAASYLKALEILEGSPANVSRPDEWADSLAVVGAGLLATSHAGGGQGAAARGPAPDTADGPGP